MTKKILRVKDITPFWAMGRVGLGETCLLLHENFLTFTVLKTNGSTVIFFQDDRQCFEGLR